MSSLLSLSCGLCLLVCNVVVPWSLRDQLYVSFLVQKEVQADVSQPMLLEVDNVDVTLHIGRLYNATRGLDSLKTSHGFSKDINRVLYRKQQQVQHLFSHIDTVAGIWVWVNGISFVMRGIVGCLGIGLKDPPYIKTFWAITICLYTVNFLFAAFCYLSLSFFSIRLASYLWYAFLCFFLVLPIHAWITCESIFSFNRILDMGGKGADYRSAFQYEQQRLISDAQPL